MMSQTPHKILLFFVVAALGLTACGVKGPPEPPLPNEASVKKMETPPPEVVPTEPAPSPVIFPPKQETPKKKKKKSSSANEASEKTDKQGP
jgi:hypothetical protein